MRLFLVFAALPFRISHDRVFDHLAHDAVATGDLNWQTGQRHGGIHEVRMLL